MSASFVEVEGATLEVLEEPRAADSRGDAPTIVMLHEGLGSARLWRDFPAEIARETGLRTVTYSRRGYGASSPVGLPRPIRFMHDEAEVHLPALLRAVEAEDDTILIGHSDGASIALLYAARRPRGLRGVVAIAPHVVVEGLTIASIEKARVAYDEGDLRPRLERHHGANVDVAFRGWNDVWLDPAFRRWNIEDEVSRIEVPVMVVQGRDDEYGTLAQVESIRAHLTPRVRFEGVVLDDAGHAPHKDKRAETLAAIVRFVANVGAAST